MALLHISANVGQRYMLSNKVIILSFSLDVPYKSSPEMGQWWYSRGQTHFTLRSHHICPARARTCLSFSSKPFINRAWLSTMSSGMLWKLIRNYYSWIDCFRSLMYLLDQTGFLPHLPPPWNRLLKLIGLKTGSLWSWLVFFYKKNPLLIEREKCGSDIF